MISTKQPEFNLEILREKSFGSTTIPVDAGSSHESSLEVSVVGPVWYLVPLLLVAAWVRTECCRCKNLDPTSSTLRKWDMILPRPSMYGIITYPM